MDIICFEKYYDDMPEEVKYSIRYDRKPYIHDKSIEGYITIKHLDDIEMPVTELEWLISCLTRIKDEL